MYNSLLTAHSLFRWLVLLSVIYSVIHNYRGYKKKRSFNKFDNQLIYITATIINIQLIMGVWLYIISPFVDAFFKDVSKGLHLREVRFFAMEHGLMMLIAVVIITVASIKAKRKKDNTAKFRTIYIWYSIALIIILTNIPWEFSPLVNRPSFRGL